jgi:hypothetical protein
MTFYSGFSLVNDQHFFESHLIHSDYTVAGFSYGAIKAARHVVDSLSRIDTLQLFSPAFFQTSKSSFKRLQLAAFVSDAQDYRKRFIHACFSPCEVQHLDTNMGSIAELEEVLYFIWDELLLQKIIDKGIRIEVYLGMKDHIIDAMAAHDFFLPYATVISMPQGNHFLQECK